MNEGFTHTRAPLPKPKFLTGTPRWMHTWWVGAIALGLTIGQLYRLVEWLLN